MSLLQPQVLGTPVAGRHSRVAALAALLTALLLPRFAAAETIRLPLQKLTSAPVLEMRCVSGEQHFYFPVAERWRVNRALLSLNYTASNNMLGDISQMVVLVNGELVAQLKLDHQVPGATSDIQIPLARLKPGYNMVSLQVAQHYQRNQCEQPCAPDLWTRVSVLDSALQLDYDLKPLPGKLGEAASWIFDSKQMSEAAANLVVDSSSAEAVTMAAVAASGIANRFEYRKVTFSHSWDIKPGVDNVLIGTKAFVRGVLEKYGIKLGATYGGLIRLFPLPKSDGQVDAAHALIVVTGEEEPELKVAAQTFANMSLPYPGNDEMYVYTFAMPDLSTHGGRGEIQPDEIYHFSTLGMPSYSFRGINGRAPGRVFDAGAASQGVNRNETSLSFRLPADFMVRPHEHARLSLNLAYGVGLRQDSALTISLNDKQVRDIHLDNPDGGFAEDKIDLPTYLFKPGSNTISFKPYLNTQRQVCDADNTDGLFVTIFGNSTLSFPPMPHTVEMPRLDLLAVNGFPFTRTPDGEQTLVYLPQPDSASIDTAFNLIGMITQKNGFPLFSAKVAFSEPKDWRGEMLVIGETSGIPKAYMERSPLQPAGIANVPYPISLGWAGETSMALSKQEGGLGDGNGLLMEFQARGSSGRTVVVATAQSEKDLLALGDALWSPAIQERISGDVALVKLDAPEYEVTSLAVGKKYSTSDKGGVSLVNAYVYANVHMFFGLAAFAMIALGLFGYWLLLHYRRKRVQTEHEQKDDGHA